MGEVLGKQQLQRTLTVNVIKSPNTAWYADEDDGEVLGMRLQRSKLRARIAEAVGRCEVPDCRCDLETADEILALVEIYGAKRKA